MRPLFRLLIVALAIHTPLLASAGKSADLNFDKENEVWINDDYHFCVSLSDDKALELCGDEGAVKKLFGKIKSGKIQLGTTYDKSCESQGGTCKMNRCYVGGASVGPCGYQQ